ncbi:MAG: MATE family efflux transporter, partial [Oscillospiraceae bacterium]|nr:MATE family efflux transporter [Oscillospiraceae bacterium]
MARTAHRDMTKGAIWKNILFFALPAMCSSLFQQLYNTVDGIVVGNHVSQNALSAVSGCAPATSLLLSIAIGLSTGGGVVVAQ